MATSTFDRPLVLTEQGVDNLIALLKAWEENPPTPDNIKPIDWSEIEKNTEPVKRLLSRSTQGRR